MNYVALVWPARIMKKLELKEKEKWHVDEVKRVKAIVGTFFWTRTRLLKVEYKQWKSR